jgi:CheY-like chemotaxis protein
MSGVVSRPQTLSERAAALEAEDLKAVGDRKRSVQRLRVDIDEDLGSYVGSMRAAGRVDEDDTGVHHLDASLERRAFARRLAEAGVPEAEAKSLAAAALAAGGPTTLRPQEIIAELARRGGGRDEHVVVLDRDPAVVTTIRNVLEHEGYKVRSAENGIDGLDRILRGPNRPDVLFIDMQLPELNGYAVLAALRETKMIDMPYVVLVDGEPCGREANVDHAHREHVDPEAVLHAARVKIGERRARGH